MQRNIFLLSGAFIFFADRFSRVDARGPSCTKMKSGTVDEILSAMNDARTALHFPKFEALKDDPTDKDLQAFTAILQAPDPKTNAKDKDGVGYNVEEGDSSTLTEANAIERVKAWIKTKTDISADGTLPKTAYNWARIAWKETKEVGCLFCPYPSSYASAFIGAGNSTFGCQFKKSPDFSAVSKEEIQANLEEPKAGGPGKDDDKAGGADTDNAKRGSSVSKFEKTVRALTLVSIIATTVVVASGFIATLLVTIKIFTGL